MKKEKEREEGNRRDPRITNSSAETRTWKCVRVCRGEINRFDRLIFKIYIMYRAVYKGNSALKETSAVAQIIAFAE